MQEVGPVAPLEDKHHHTEGSGDRQGKPQCCFERHHDRSEYREKENDREAHHDQTERQERVLNTFGHINADRGNAGD